MPPVIPPALPRFEPTAAPLSQTHSRSRRRRIIAACCLGVGLLLGMTALVAIFWPRQAPRAAAPAESNSASPADPSPQTGQADAAPVSSPEKPRDPGETEPTAVPAPFPELCYRWRDGQQYSYRISCQARIDGTQVDIRGSNTYTVGRPSSALAAGSDATPGSGTAFVVSPDGYLITCDHVVNNATDVKVTLGDQTSPCKVLARDSAHDVALLQIARQGLAALPLADSENVQLAEEVRAVGYPLSDVLGSSVKVTRGSVAGIVDRPRGKVFQIDAVVNPGNSGGPLLDARGAVVGVVNAQLVGMQVSKVGFAVPVNYAKQLLTQEHVAFQAAVAGESLDGPALARRVSPSVGFVTMICHGGAKPDQDRLTLYYHGILDFQRPATDGMGSLPAPTDLSKRDDGTLAVDDSGEIGRFTGRLQLPCLLGPVGAVAIDALPGRYEKTWNRDDVLAIKLTNGPEDPLAGVHPPGFAVPQAGPRLMGPPSYWPEPEEHYSVRRQAAYTLTETKGALATIHKRLELKSLDGPDVTPILTLTGEGDTLFDCQIGMPQKVTFSGTFTMHRNGSELRVPVTLQCERIVESEPAAIVAPLPADAPAPPRRPERSIPPRSASTVSWPISALPARIGASALRLSKN